MNKEKAYKFIRENYKEIKSILKEKKEIKDRLLKLYKESADKDEYEDVVFLQGKEADEPLRILNDEGTDAALTYLKQWHQPGNHMGSEELGHGSDDRTYEKDGYVMSWNSRIGYIGLQYDLSKLDETSGIGTSLTVKKSAPQRLSESEESPKQLKQIDIKEAEELFNKGIYIYIKTEEGKPSSTLNSFSLNNKTFDGSMNIYTGNQTPMEYGFENIINWITERAKFPLEFYTFYSETPWIVDEDAEVIGDMDEGIGMSLINKKGDNTKPSSLYNTDVVINETIRKKVQEILLKEFKIIK